MWRRTLETYSERMSTGWSPMDDLASNLKIDSIKADIELLVVPELGAQMIQGPASITE